MSFLPAARQNARINWLAKVINSSCCAIRAYRIGMAWAHFLLGEYRDAQGSLQRALADSPSHLPALRLKAAVDVATGDIERARQTMSRILELNPGERISNINIVRLSHRPEDRTRTMEYLRLAGMPE